MTLYKYKLITYMKKPVKPIVEETEIVVVLDRSGSMKKIAEATVNGFNEFLEEHKNAEGSAKITLAQFDDRYELDYKSLPISEAKSLVLNETFVPRGTTALYDAIGITINNTKTTSDVIFVIITDGAENASGEFTREDVFNLIKEHEDNKGWKFIFLAANQDAIKTGNTIGIRGNRAMTYNATAQGTTAAFKSVASNTSSYRSAKFASMSGGAIANVDLQSLENSLDFSDDQRKEQ